MCIVCNNPTWTWKEVYAKTKGDIKGKMCQECEENYLFQVADAVKSRKASKKHEETQI